jgi:hypothetical protein
MNCNAIKHIICQKYETRYTNQFPEILWLPKHQSRWKVCLYTSSKWNTINIPTCNRREMNGDRWIAPSILRSEICDFTELSELRDRYDNTIDTCTHRRWAESTSSASLTRVYRIYRPGTQIPSKPVVGKSRSTEKAYATGKSANMRTQCKLNFAIKSICNCHSIGNPYIQTIYLRRNVNPQNNWSLQPLMSHIRE